jgi:hypothetical protein
VTDVSYIEDPDVIFIGLKLHNETLRNIALRLEAVFKSEKLKVSLEVEKGEFVKIKNPGFSAQLKRVK